MHWFGWVCICAAVLSVALTPFGIASGNNYAPLIPIVGASVLAIIIPYEPTEQDEQEDMMRYEK